MKIDPPYIKITSKTVWKGKGDQLGRLGKNKKPLSDFQLQSLQSLRYKF